MCRLFGFRSIINSRVHHSLINADNALNSQSANHPDGWGVAYYVAGAPHIIKSVQPAYRCNLFQKISGVVSSHAVIAHIRNATMGENNIVNTHPFQYGPWTFAHNGNIKNFSDHREKVLSEIPEELSRFILGSTDSEIIFFYLLSKLQEKFNIQNKQLPLLEVFSIIRSAIMSLTDIVGPFSQVDDAGEQETYMTFLLTNGDIMLGHQGGKQLYYSTHKTKCIDRDSCPSFSDECENETKTGKVNHLQFSSEALQGDNIWLPMKNSQLIGVDHEMKLYIQYT